MDKIELVGKRKEKWEKMMCKTYNIISYQPKNWKTYQICLVFQAKNKQELNSILIQNLNLLKTEKLDTFWLRLANKLNLSLETQIFNEEIYQKIINAIPAEKDKINLIELFTHNSSITASYEISLFSQTNPLYSVFNQILSTYTRHIDVFQLGQSNEGIIDNVSNINLLQNKQLTTDIINEQPTTLSQFDTVSNITPLQNKQLTTNSLSATDIINEQPTTLSQFDNTTKSAEQKNDLEIYDTNTINLPQMKISLSNDINTENINNKDINPDDINIEDINIEDINIEDIKKEDIKKEDIQIEDIKKDIKIEDIIENDLEEDKSNVYENDMINLAQMEISGFYEHKTDLDELTTSIDMNNLKIHDDKENDVTLSNAVIEEVYNSEVVSEEDEDVTDDGEEDVGEREEDVVEDRQDRQDRSETFEDWEEINESHDKIDRIDWCIQELEEIKENISLLEDEGKIEEIINVLTEMRQELSNMDEDEYPWDIDGFNDNNYHTKNGDCHIM